MLHSGVRSLHRTVLVDTGNSIFVDMLYLGNGQWRDRIRITGGPGGRGVTTLVVFRAVGNKIARRITLPAGVTHVDWALNDTTVVAFRANVSPRTAVLIRGGSRTEVTQVRPFDAGAPPVVSFYRQQWAGISSDGKHVLLRSDDGESMLVDAVWSDEHQRFDTARVPPPAPLATIRQAVVSPLRDDVVVVSEALQLPGSFVTERFYFRYQAFSGWSDWAVEPYQIFSGGVLASNSRPAVLFTSSGEPFRASLFFHDVQSVRAVVDLWVNGQQHAALGIAYFGGGTLGDTEVTFPGTGALGDVLLRVLRPENEAQRGYYWVRSDGAVHHARDASAAFLSASGRVLFTRENGVWSARDAEGVIWEQSEDDGYALVSPTRTSLRRDGVVYDANYKLAAIRDGRLREIGAVPRLSTGYTFWPDEFVPRPS